MAQNQSSPRPGSLVLYKIRPARVLAVGDKVEIELEGGQIKRVRPKDIKLLHPGPLSSLADLGAREGELAEAWELLEGDETTLGGLSIGQRASCRARIPVSNYSISNRSGIRTWPCSRRDARLSPTVSETLPTRRLLIWVS